MAMINWNNFGLFDLRSLYHVFYCFTDLTKKNTEDISVVIAKITVNAVISKLRLLTTETAECILSAIMLSLMSALTARAAFLAANELGYFNRKNVFLLLNGRLS